MSIFFDADHTWAFNGSSQVTAPNYVYENIGFIGYLAMDFTEPMPADVAIESISAATVADIGGSTEPVISSSAVSYDKKKALLQVTCASATAATYTFTVTIVTTDSQTIVRKGRLVLS